ncbi:MAG: 2,4-dihydroxyhept-2-ene-1,7-dioic acid aldolase, partial [Oscillospiraceae bacterium]
HPEVQKVIREVEKKVLAKGKLLATVGANPAAAKVLYDRGYSYVIFASDVTTLRASVANQVKEFKELTK